MKNDMLEYVFRERLTHNTLVISDYEPGDEDILHSCPRGPAGTAPLRGLL